MTATLSVAAVQLIVALVVVTLDALTLDGAVGAVVS